MAIYNEETDPNIKIAEDSMKPTSTKRVVFEIEVETETNIEAAKTVQEWLADGTKYQFYVQDAETKKIVSIDLDEDESCMELPADNYSPMIEK